MLSQYGAVLHHHPTELSFYGTLCYWLTNLIDMPICFALIGLSLNLFIQMYQNITTIEGFGKYGLIQRRYPCVGVTASAKDRIPNPYDVLWPNNLK